MIQNDNEIDRKFPSGNIYIYSRYYIAQCWIDVFFDTDCIICLSYLQSNVKFVIAICSNRDILNTLKDGLMRVT